MNKKQRAIIIGGIVAIIIMFLFPPYALYQKNSKYDKGYEVNHLVTYFLGEPPSETESLFNRGALNIGTLSIQYVTVFIIGSLLWMLARDTKLKDNPKGDQEKTK
jgi:CDP-diglyceride synthetase